jgi:hypothetical protein
LSPSFSGPASVRTEWRLKRKDHLLVAILDITPLAIVQLEVTSAARGNRISELIDSRNL